MQKDKPHVRLQELLRIPEAQRTEAQWSELNELEIALAPGNTVQILPPQGSGRFNGITPAAASSSNPNAQRKKRFNKMYKGLKRGP